MPVQVIRPHVEERRDFEAGVLEIVELERRDFEYEQACSTRLLQAPGKGPPGVAGDGVRHARSLEHAVEHVDDGGLSVGACDGRTHASFPSNSRPRPTSETI